MFDWQSTYEEYKDEELLKAAFESVKVDTVQEGVQHLLNSLEEQMRFDQNKEARCWSPRNMGITILQTFVDAQEVKSSIWNITQSVERHFVNSKIVRLLPARFPRTHSGWQFFMSGAGDITNPHIDPSLTRSVFWQVIGSKLWGIWPATKENLAVFEKSAAKERTWSWAMANLSERNRKLFIMEPGTWWEVKHSSIHACISLSPSAHAAQEFFFAGDAEVTLDLWKTTQEAREKDTAPIKIDATHLPKPLSEWLPTIFAEQDKMDKMVENAMGLYNYGLEMVITGKSDQVTLVSEVCDMLPLVRHWIEAEADRQGR